MTVREHITINTNIKFEDIIKNLSENLFNKMENTA